MREWFRIDDHRFYTWLTRCRPFHGLVVTLSYAFLGLTPQALC